MGMNITPQDRAEYVKAHPEAAELTQQELDAKIAAEKQKAGEEMQEGLSSKEESFIDETAAWIKENPVETAAIGLGTVALGILGKRAGVFAKAGKFLAGLFSGRGANVAKTVAIGTGVAGLAVGMSSCVNQDTDITLQSGLTVEQIKQAFKEALKENNGELAQDIKKAIIDGLKESGVTGNIENILKWLEMMYGMQVQNGNSLNIIIGILQDLGFTMDKILEGVTQTNAQMNILIELMVQNNQKQEEILDVLTENNNELKAIREELDKIFASISDIKDLTAENKELLGAALRVLIQIKQGQQVNTEILLKILAALKTVIGKQDDMAKNMQAGLTAILTALQNLDANNTEKQNEIIELLNKIIANDKATMDLIQKYGARIINAILTCGMAIISVIEKYGDGILATLEKNNDKMDVIIGLINKYGTAVLDVIAQNGDKLDTIIDLFNKYGTQITALLEAHGDKLNVIINLLEKYGDSILDAINQYGDAILNAMDKFSGQMDVLINLINNSGKSLDEIKKILEAINKNTINNGHKLDIIIANMKQYKTEILKAIQELQGSVNDVNVTIGDFNGTISAYYQKVLAKLEVIINMANGGDCNCNMDFEALMAKLQEILEAIKNHKCECTHTDSGNHEGILGDLDGILS